MEKIRAYLEKLKTEGLVFPMLRDPIKKQPSVSLTILFISTNVVMAGMIGKLSGALGGIDLTQALYWFGMCAALYFGRSFSGDTGKNVNMDNKNKEENK